MSTSTIVVSNLDELPEVARQILLLAGDRKVFAWYAQMGAGKTTLIKEICRQLGSSDHFSSPTYSIVNEYRISEQTKIYHIDLYRLKDVEEALSIGIEDYLYSNYYCFVEWPELVEHLLPEDTVKVTINSDGNIRNVSIFIGH